MTRAVQLFFLSDPEAFGLEESAAFEGDPSDFAESLLFPDFVEALGDPRLDEIDLVVAKRRENRRCLVDDGAREGILGRQLARLV